MRIDARARDVNIGKKEKRKEKKEERKKRERKDTSLCAAKQRDPRNRSSRAVSCRAVPCRAVPCRAMPCHAELTLSPRLLSSLFSIIDAKRSYGFRKIHMRRRLGLAQQIRRAAIHYGLTTSRMAASMGKPAHYLISVLA
jgi:hypothetical protein